MDINSDAKHNAPAPFFAQAVRNLGIPAEQLQQFIEEYTSLQVVYRSAIREVRTRLEILDDEFQFQHKRNPIHHIQSRLKTPRSMLEKLSRRNLDPSIETIRSELTDIAGIRVICSYVDDIYLLADLLLRQDNIELVRRNDYIRKPKPNGYRSLHIVITVPVYFSGGKQRVPVEIQIRTIAMDFWASLEHELRYKSASQVSADIVRELHDCAQHIAELDVRMQRVYHQMEHIEEEMREEE